LNMRPLGLLAVGLVIATTVIVAVVAHAAIDDLGWSSAFVLGAIVSPTDPVAASAIARRFGVPRRLVTLIEGESLINDGTALVAFVLTALLFVLIGLQLPVILDQLSGEPAGTLLAYGAIVSATVIVVRIAWVFPATYIPRALSRRIRERDPYPPWQYPAFISWTGMRGAVSLAAALALPLTTDSGGPFPGRDLILFLAFCVLFATPVGQGLSMPIVIRVLGLESDRLSEKEETKARIRAAEAALE